MDTGYINRDRNDWLSLRKTILNGLTYGYKHIGVQLSNEAVSFK